MAKVLKTLLVLLLEDTQLIDSDIEKEEHLEGAHSFYALFHDINFSFHLHLTLHSIL